MFRYLLFVLIGAAPSGAQAAESLDRFEVTLTFVLPDGSERRETRPLRADEIRSMGVLDGGEIDASNAGVADGAPTRPDPPTSGSVPDDLLRVRYHQAADGWTRDTVYRRSHGGEWQLRDDALRRAVDKPASGGKRAN